MKPDKKKVDKMAEFIKKDQIRTFPTGATRNSSEGKLDYKGFLSPIVLKRYAMYLHKHRKQADGVMRGSDNWKLGIDKDTYMESKLRHTMDMWLHHEGYGDQATETLEDSICGDLFNTMGYLFELLKENASK
jgi:hypothetical protein